MNNILTIFLAGLVLRAILEHHQVKFIVLQMIKSRMTKSIQKSFRININSYLLNKGCRQYYTEDTGEINSFNFAGDGDTKYWYPQNYK